MVSMDELVMINKTELICVLFKVIYKKFQIPCPLVPEDFDGLNETLKVLNTTASYLNRTPVAYGEDVCTPKYFVFNSQVNPENLEKTIY